MRFKRFPINTICILYFLYSSEFIYEAVCKYEMLNIPREPIGTPMSYCRSKFQVTWYLTYEQRMVGRNMEAPITSVSESCHRGCGYTRNNPHLYK